jgi:hypothetical protein
VEIDKVYEVDAELIAAIEKIPADRALVQKTLTDWENEGQIAKMSTFSQLMVVKMGDNLESIALELRQLRQSVESTKVIGVAALAGKFANCPELLTGFEVFIDPEDDNLKISYKGQTGKRQVAEGYDRLHLYLAQHFGYKEIHHSTMAQAIIKSHNWRNVQLEQLNEIDKKTLILTKAECLLLRKKARKITIPELKTYLLPLQESTSYIKETLLDAGWTIVKSGTCKTSFFTIIYQDN